jgi:hypothetical protein
VAARERFEAGPKGRSAKAQANGLGKAEAQTKGPQKATQGYRRDYSFVAPLQG